MSCGGKMKKAKPELNAVDAYKKYKNQAVGPTICFIGFWSVIALNVITYVFSTTIWNLCWTIGLSVGIVYIGFAVIYMRHHEKKLKELKVKAFGEPEKIEYSKMFKEIWHEYNSEDLELLQVFIKGERKFDTDDMNNSIIVTMNMKKDKITITFDNNSAIMEIVSKTKPKNEIEFNYENYKDMVDLFNQISIEIDKLKEPTKKHK